MLKKLHFQIILGLIAGIIFGQLIPQSGAPLGALGKLFIQLIKAIATPLLFAAIVQAIIQADMSLRNGLRMLGFSLLNAFLALVVALTISNIFKPGLYLKNLAGTPGSTDLPSLSFEKFLAQFFPDSFLQPFVKNEMVAVVVLSVLVGLSLRTIKNETQEATIKFFVERIGDVLFRVFELILHWIVRLAPFAVFGVVARVSAEHGFDAVKSLGIYLLAILGALAFHTFVTYSAWIVFYLKKSINKFWTIAQEPVVYSFGVNSSLATLPLTLKALDKLKVSKGASALGACVGTNLNNDGILLYQGLAALMVAQASGFDLDLTQQLTISFMSLIACLGIAGVPEAGLISLSIVLASANLPLELVPVMLSVDWLVGRVRSMVNVTNDIVISMLIDGRQK